MKQQLLGVMLGFFFAFKMFVAIASHCASMGMF